MTDDEIRPADSRLFWRSLIETKRTNKLLCYRYCTSLWVASRCCCGTCFMRCVVALCLGHGHARPGALATGRSIVVICGGIGCKVKLSTRVKHSYVDLLFWFFLCGH